MNKYVQFLREDALTSLEKALPAAGASAYTDWIDLGGAGILGQVEFQISNEAVPSLADAKTLTLVLEHSADKATVVTHTDVAALVSTGAGGAGAVAASSQFKLPSTTRRYIRAKATVQAAGGDNTAKKFFLKAKF